MKRFVVCLSVSVFLLATTVSAQQKQASSTSGGIGDVDFPTIESMLTSLNAEAGAKETSLTDSIDKMMQSMSAAGSAENTEKSVLSAIEGQLIVEDVIPETNKVVVESVDRKTNRYSPRLKLDFVSFPLARPASVEASVPAKRIAGHLQYRLRLDRSIEVVFQDRTACLRGTVSTDRQKELAEMILRLEPGVDAVKNELVVDRLSLAQ